MIFKHKKRMGNTTSVTQWSPSLSHWSWVSHWGMVSTWYNIAPYVMLLEIFWSLLIFLCFFVSSAFNVSQPYYAVGGQGQVSLQCIFNTMSQPEEMQVSIYKGKYGEERICSAYVNITNPHIETSGRTYCKGNVSKGKVDLTIFGLRGEDTDLYRCRVEVIFPPPYISKFGNGTLLYIPGKRCSWIWHSLCLSLSHSSLTFAHPFTYLQTLCMDLQKYLSYMNHCCVY